jgi:hypothetical protein
MGKAYGKTWKQWKNLVTMIQWISLRGKLQETLKPLYIFYIYIYIGWDLDGENHDLLQVFPSTNPVNDV